SIECDRKYLMNLFASQLRGVHDAEQSSALEGRIDRHWLPFVRAGTLGQLNAQGWTPAPQSVNSGQVIGPKHIEHHGYFHLAIVPKTPSILFSTGCVSTQG